ncbi:MAG TPA: hypothetical protein VL357_12235 [Rariglobus sp.]|jgi:serine/threonine-protein kinase|nr:hypothetical protein [Rariglobus sp.]
MDISKAKSAIKRSFICGIISTFITLIATLVVLYRGDFRLSGVPISIYTLVDVILMAGLTTGLFFKSRICAILMVTYFLWSKYMQFSSGMEIPPVAFVVSLVFLYFYIEGMRGTFAYHRLKRRRRSHHRDDNEPPSLPASIN